MDNSSTAAVAAPLNGDKQATVPFGPGAKRLVASLFLITLVITSGVVIATAPTAESLAALRNFHPALAALATMLALAPWITSAIRNTLWARFFGVDLRFRDGVRMAVAVEVGSAVTPTATGGGYIKLGILAAHGLPVGAAGCLMVLGTVEHAIFYATAVPIALVIPARSDHGSFDKVYDQVAHELQRVQWPALSSTTAVAALALALAIAATLLAIWISQRARLHGRPAQLLQSAKGVAGSFADGWALIGQKGVGLLAVSVALAGLGIAARFSVVWLVFLGLGESTDPVFVGALQWVVYATAGIVPSPGGVGAAEGAFIAVYSALLPLDKLLIAAILWRVFTWYAVVAAGALLLGASGSWGMPKRE